MNDKTLALLNEVTNSLADDIEDFSCGELRQALYRAIAQREEAATRIEALEAALGWYADKDNWRTKGHPQIDWNDKPILRDQGRRAKQALEGEQHVD